MTHRVNSFISPRRGSPLFPARRQLTVCNKLGTGDADCHDQSADWSRKDKTGDVFAVGAAIGRPCSQFGGNTDPAVGAVTGRPFFPYGGKTDLAVGAVTGRPSSAAGAVIGRPLFPARRQLTDPTRHEVCLMPVAWSLMPRKKNR